MANDIRLDSGIAPNLGAQSPLESHNETPLVTGESPAKRLVKIAQENAEALAIQKLFASVEKIFSSIATQKSDGSSNSAKSSLPDLPVPTGPLNLNTLMKALAFDTRKQACKDGIDSLENRSKDQAELGKAQLDELAKQISAMEKKDFWGGILKVFQWIGALIGVIASAASLVAGALTANPALIAAGVIGCIMATESIISMATDGKVSLLNGFTELFKACGMEEETAQKWAMGVQALITVATIAVSVAAAVSKVPGKAVELSSTVLEKIFTISMKCQMGLNITSAGLAGVQGSLGIANSIFQSDADHTKANSKELEALMEQVRMAFEAEQGLLKSEMERISVLMEKTTELVNDCNRTQSKIVSTAPTMA